MPPRIHTDDIIQQLDAAVITVPVVDTADRLPTLACDDPTHEGDAIREGEHATFLLTPSENGEWSIDKTICHHCSIIDCYSEYDASQTIAIVEAIFTPANLFGPSPVGHLQNAYLWEICEDQV